MAKINDALFNSALELIKTINAKALIIYADLFDDIKILKNLDISSDVILATQFKTIIDDDLDGLKVIQLPKVDMSRMGLIKVSIMMAISAGFISYNDKIVCLSGPKNIGYFDSLMVIDLERESEIISSRAGYNITDEALPEVFAEALTICIELAKQGRENKPVGTIFVIGDHENVLRLSRQLVMNPFHGHPENERQILNQNLRETLKEFSSIDGAFIIRGDGVVLCAGRHLNTSLDGEELMSGLGCRHVAAAGITSLTKSIALVISQSTGSVRIFKNGKIIMQIEKNVT